MRFMFQLLLVAVSTVHAQDCGHLWQHDLKTATLGPKGYMGDTHAAYGIQSFFNKGKKYYVVKGQFPRARFFSIETYEGTKNGDGQSLNDYQMVPDAGSVNPFHDGVSLNAKPRNYTVYIAPEGAPKFGPNQLSFSKKEKYISFYIRYYSPTQGIQVQLSDLPQVEAYDLKTRQPSACGKSWPVENFTNYPQFLGALSHKPEGVFSFELAKWNKGSNTAVGKYAEGHSEMRFDEVALLRFKPPTFASTFSGEGAFSSQTQVRYWSLCAINFPNNQGLVCLADHLTPPDASGFVTVVNGTGPEVAELAKQKGYYYIPDIRPATSKMILFAFRNILPSAEFKANSQYKGDYNPKMRICPRTDFLAGKCEWWD
ncbi:hypothetical protein EBQ90_00640 [bacterium]|nr:hypothetical protein [bacterium]